MSYKQQNCCDSAWISTFLHLRYVHDFTIAFSHDSLLLTLSCFLIVIFYSYLTFIYTSVGIASNKSRLDMAKKSAKRFYKRSYDSDRNSYSGEQGVYKRNSSESLNAAMRSIVQRNETGIQYAYERDRIGEGEDNESEMQDHNFQSVSAGSEKACSDNQNGIGIDNLVGVNDKMATSSIKRIAAKSLTSIISARNRKMDSNKVIPYRGEVDETLEANL